MNLKVEEHFLNQNFQLSWKLANYCCACKNEMKDRQTDRNRCGGGGGGGGANILQYNLVTVCSLRLGQLQYLINIKEISYSPVDDVRGLREVITGLGRGISPFHVGPSGLCALSRN